MQLSASSYTQNRILISLRLSLFHKSSFEVFLPDNSSSIQLKTKPVSFFPTLWSSPRPISKCQLSTLLHLHLIPIYLVVFKGSYNTDKSAWGYLILRGASRLDAFSVYPVRTWLPCHGSGKPTGTPAVRPSRSSRTKDSSSQISYACAG